MIIGSGDKSVSTRDLYVSDGELLSRSTIVSSARSKDTSVLSGFTSGAYVIILNLREEPEGLPVCTRPHSRWR